MIIQKIKYNSDKYKNAVNLRNKILYIPLGLELDKQKLDKEKDYIHIGCFENNTIVGTLLLTPIDKNTTKMKQVAVENNHQGKGIGSKLIIFAEKTAIEHGFSKIIISSRTSVLDFYKKMGYKTEGKEYISKNTKIPHFKMTKNII